MKNGNRIGEIYPSKEGYQMEIIEDYGYNKITVQLNDGTILKNRGYDKVVKGTIKNPFHKSIHGEGYLGIGRHKTKVGGKMTKMYYVYCDMFKRCYSENSRKKNKTYIDCKVGDNFRCYQDFGDWFEENYKPEYMKGWALDKDILFKGNKIYSPETCCFVPREINNLFIKCKNIRGDYPIGVFYSKSNGKFEANCMINGNQMPLGTFDTPEEAFQAYKVAKELNIKRVANKYRGQITEQCYWALMNYEVEETD